MQRALVAATKSLCDAFRIDLPIIQAPMAGGQGSALAISVSNAGGLGSLPCAMLTSDQIRAEVAAIRAATSKPFNLNFFSHTPPQPDSLRETRWLGALSHYYKELGVDSWRVPASPGRAPFTGETAELLEELRPPVVSFHFGLPSAALLTKVKATGALVLSSATTIEEALWLQARGVDAVIAQGVEAGGHRGMFLTDDLSTQSGTLVLVPQLVDALKVPRDSRGGYRGCQGCASRVVTGGRCGTDWYRLHALSRGDNKPNSPHRTTKQPLAEHRADAPCSGRPARGIVNRLVREMGPMNEVAPAFPLAAQALAPLRSKAESLGLDDFSPLWCGQNASNCAEIPALELTRRIARII